MCIHMFISHACTHAHIHEFIFVLLTADYFWLLRYQDQDYLFGHDKDLCYINTLCLLFLSLYLGCAAPAQPNKGLPRVDRSRLLGPNARAFLAPFLLGSSTQPSCLEAPEEQMAWHHLDSPVSACLLGLSSDPRLAVSLE